MRKAFILPLLLLLLVVDSEAVKQTSIEGLRHASYKSRTRVVVDLDGPVEYSHHRLSNPDRIYFDLKGCRISRKAKKSFFNVNDKIIKSVRIARFNKQVTRIVFDLKNARNYYAFTLENPYRLVVDVYRSEEKESEHKEEKEKRRIIKERKAERIRTIVIDPGHGGKDPGAIGPRGIKEKDITLSVARNLGKIIQKRYNVNVVYTRERDVFVPLNERTEIANSRKADLFISIHTNASRSRRTRGVETYFLNWTNNSEAMKVAARENKVSLEKMKKMQNALQMILQDLARNNKREESMRLAHSVQNAMVKTLKKNYTRVNDLGVKYAFFYVLVGAEMPSVLVEISFISNREEERRLASINYRKRVAEAIARGLNSYINQSTLIVNPVRDNKKVFRIVSGEDSNG